MFFRHNQEPILGKVYSYLEDDKKTKFIHNTYLQDKLFTTYFIAYTNLTICFYLAYIY